MLSVNVFDGMDVNHFFVSILVSHNILRVTVIHFRFLPIHLTSRILLNAGKEGFASDKYTVASPQFFICNFVFLVFLNPPQIGTVNPFEREIYKKNSKRFFLRSIEMHTSLGDFRMLDEKRLKSLKAQCRS